MRKKLKIILIFLVAALSIIIILISNSSKQHEYELPYNMTVMDLTDSNNIFVNKTSNNNIYKYNLTKNTYELFRKPQEESSKIINIKVSNEWISWIEVKSTTQSIYINNRKSNKITKLYEGTYEIIQLDGHYLIYNKKDINKKYILLRNLDTNKEIVLDNTEKNSELNISVPYISDNKVVWSKDRFDKIKNLMIADVFIYDINTKEKKVISNQSNISKPKINGSILIGTHLESNIDYTKSSLVLYNFNKNRWDNLISQQNDIYKNLKHVSIDDPIFDKNLVSWWDNDSKNIYLYNIKKKKTINITNNKKNDLMNQVYFIKNGIIFYKSLNSENTIRRQVCIIF